MTVNEFVIFFRIFFGLWVGFWAIPFLFFSIRTALGGYKHILFLDEQLASERFKSRNDSALIAGLDYTFQAIGTRFHCYCILFPFIRKRATTTKRSFWLVMWLHSLWFWSLFFFIILVMISKAMNI